MFLFGNDREASLGRSLIEVISSNFDFFFFSLQKNRNQTINNTEIPIKKKVGFEKMLTESADRKFVREEMLRL